MKSLELCNQYKFIHFYSKLLSTEFKFETIITRKFFYYLCFKYNYVLGDSNSLFTIFDAFITSYSPKKFINKEVALFVKNYTFGNTDERKNFKLSKDYELFKTDLKNISKLLILISKKKYTKENFKIIENKDERKNNSLKYTVKFSLKTAKDFDFYINKDIPIKYNNIIYTLMNNGNIFRFNDFRPNLIIKSELYDLFPKPMIALNKRNQYNTEYPCYDIFCLDTPDDKIYSFPEIFYKTSDIILSLTDSNMFIYRECMDLVSSRGINILTNNIDKINKHLGKTPVYEITKNPKTYLISRKSMDKEIPFKKMSSFFDVKRTKDNGMETNNNIQKEWNRITNLNKKKNIDLDNIIDNDSDCSDCSDYSYYSDTDEEINDSECSDYECELDDNSRKSNKEKMMIDTNNEDHLGYKQDFNNKKTSISDNTKKKFLGINMKKKLNDKKTPVVDTKTPVVDTKTLDNDNDNNKRNFLGINMWKKPVVEKSSSVDKKTSFVDKKTSVVDTKTSDVDDDNTKKKFLGINMGKKPDDKKEKKTKLVIPPIINKTDEISKKEYNVPEKITQNMEKKKQSAENLNVDEEKKIKHLPIVKAPKKNRDNEVTEKNNRGTATRYRYSHNYSVGVEDHNEFGIPKDVINDNIVLSKKKCEICGIKSLGKNVCDVCVKYMKKKKEENGNKNNNDKKKPTNHEKTQIIDESPPLVTQKALGKRKNNKEKNTKNIGYQMNNKLEENDEEDYGSSSSSDDEEHFTAKPLNNHLADIIMYDESYSGESQNDDEELEISQMDLDNMEYDPIDSGIPSYYGLI